MFPHYGNRRIQPYLHATDGDWQTLLAFTRTALPVLATDFVIPEQGQQIKNQVEPWDYEEYITRYGDDTSGLDCLHRIELESRAGGNAVDIAKVTAYGLPADLSYEIECTRSWYNPRFMEIRLKGPKEQVEAVLTLFDSTFDSQSKIAPERIQTMLTSANVAIRVGAWQGAEMYAKLVLDVQPDEPEALFSLGVARGAQGDIAEAERLLKRVLELKPDHHDALYNLSLAYQKRGEFTQAIETLRTALSYSPDNHPILYQLASSLEAAGQIEEALAMYQEALRTSPNRDGHWGYRGLDFTRLAEEAVKRLEGRQT